MIALALLALATQAVGPPSVAPRQNPEEIPVTTTLASSLHFANDIMATRTGDERLFVLLGSGFLRPLTTGSAKTFVADWLQRHPTATVTPVSRLLTTNTISHRQSEIVYIWIEDGSVCLNVDLVGAGLFLGATMADMVDNRKGLDALLAHDPKLADARGEIEKERAAAPQDRDERLVSERIYQTHLARFAAAEQEARVNGRGLWSDAMREDREAEGIR